MLGEKIKKKTFVFPILTTIIIGCIAVLSNQETVMNFAFHEDSGENEPDFELERKVLNVIEWSFRSTSDVSLLIIKKSTLEYYQRIASEMSSEWGLDYNQLMEEFLETFYVSRGKLNDLGKYHVHSSGLHLIRSTTAGTISYTIKCDPFSIDLMWILYGILGITTSIGTICSFPFKKLIKMKSINEKNSIVCEHHHNSCERCGMELESDSIFCHECGIRLFLCNNS